MFEARNEDSALRNPILGRQRPAEASETGVDHDAPSVRLAIYDSLTSIPRVVELTSDDYREFIDLMSNKTYEFSQSKGGKIPFTVIREVVENLIHAYFQEAVITILDEGNTIRIADQGPGIADKERAFIPGVTSATREMKQYIRGVGSGLPVALEMLKASGGTITVEDNIDQGSVVTLRLPQQTAQKEEPKPATERQRKDYGLTDRQKQVLFLVTELGPVGPSRIRAELNTSLSSAYRDLSALEECGLVKVDANGKRALTNKGMEHLEEIVSS